MAETTRTPDADVQKDNIQPIIKPIHVDIPSQIMMLLGNNPGLRAREIAKEIGVDKFEINDALHEDLRGKCSQDDSYRWYLNKDKPKEQTSVKISKTTLSSLCNYYLQCLSYVDEGGVSTYAESKYGLDYVELSSLLIAGVPSFNISEARHLTGKIRKDRSRLEMYLGYPTALRKVSSKKSSWEGYFVEPIFLYPIELRNDEAIVSQTMPLINVSAIKKFSNTEREQIMDELAQLNSELGLSEEEIPELDDLAKRLEAIRPEWPWMEKLQPNELNADPPLGNIKNEGIYNRAVLIVGERSPFTQGLESELKALAETPYDQYEDTVLGQWLKGNISENEGGIEDVPLLEVLPLNSEQRQAIKNSLSNFLTIITGPPGTGKSQVVTDLLINAAWQEKKVLFASKNNKAVDVVETRINNLGSRPILLRMGSKEYQVKLAEYLISLLTSTVSAHDKEEFSLDKDNYKRLEAKLVELENEERLLIDLRNKTDQLDRLIVKSNIPNEKLQKLKSLDFNEYNQFKGVFESALISATPEEQGLISKLLWRLLKERRLSNLQRALSNLMPVIELLPINIPTSLPGGESSEDWNRLKQEIGKYLNCSMNANQYQNSLQQLLGARPLEDISKERAELLSQLSKNARNLWGGWLKLQPSEISNSDRQLLSQYSSLLKMVLDTGNDLYTKLGKKLYSEYSNLSKKVAHLMPTWAITSLSARGKIPFEPGYFDLVVFDEASQCDIASALPLLYRAKRAVIIGDPKQLSHISGLQRGQDQQLLQNHNLIPDFAHWAYSYNSLFDLASGFVSGDDVVSLCDHHRSHADIINFSNDEFYASNLRVATNYDKLIFPQSEKNGIRWVNVSGSVKRPEQGGAINESEASAVVQELDRLVNQQHYQGTIGVVTPFRAQANLIRNLVNNNTTLSTNLINHQFLVDTVHKFQGDERDIMIFSPVVSKNMPSGGLMFLQNNGNLFNVAITRARAMLLVVGDLSATQKCGVSYLANFANYVSQLNIQKEKAATIFEADPNGQYPEVASPERVSDWEKILYEALFKAGIKAIPQYQVEKYTLDLALIKGDKMLDIEVDGERYHRNWTGELCRRDQLRNQRLFELGWDVKRFWVYEVRDYLDECVKQVLSWQDS